MRVKVVLFLLIALCGRECKGATSSNLENKDEFSENDSSFKKKMSTAWYNFCKKKNTPGKITDAVFNFPPFRYFFSYIYLQGGGKPNILGKGWEWRNNYYVFYEVGWFPKTLNFNKNFRIGIIDCGINIPIVFYNFLRFSVFCNGVWEEEHLFLFTFLFDILGNLHLLSFNFSSFFKIKIFTMFGFWAAWQSYTKDSKNLLIWNAFDFYHNHEFSKRGSSESPWNCFNPIFLALMPRIHFSFYEFLAFLKNKSENEDENIENENQEEYEKENFE